MQAPYREDPAWDLNLGRSLRDYAASHWATLQLELQKLFLSLWKQSSRWHDVRVCL